MNTTNPTILSAQSVTKSFGAQPILEEVSIAVHEGERIGLIGRNGSGKSTLLRILAGELAPDDGLVTRRQGLRVATLRQSFEAEAGQIVQDVLDRAVAEILDDVARYETLSQEADGTQSEVAQEELSALHHNLEVRGAWQLPERRKRIIQELRLPDASRALDELSGGELRRIGLAEALLRQPDVLLLDEPTNHIDAESAAWIERFLSAWPGACILITHDRYFLELVVKRIVELDRSRLYSFPGNYHQFLEYKTQVENVEVQTDANRKRVLERELTWLRRGPKGRGTKEKARIRRYDHLSDEDDSIRKNKNINFRFPTPPRLGKRIIEVDNLSCTMDGRTLFQNLKLIMTPGMRLGIAGPNGCGKTTLLRAFMGQEPNVRGKILIGENTQFIYVDQLHEEINPEKSVMDFVSGGAQYAEVNGQRVYIPSYLESLLFDGEAVRQPMRNLSGGERNRIELAKKLLQSGNVLVLDEPTNDLDLPTLRVLEEAIDVFEGCVIVVSHDRYFLNRICTHMIVFSTEEELYSSAGDYDDYIRVRDVQRKQNAAARNQENGSKRESDAASKPKRASLTYMEKRELAGIESTIELAEGKASDLEAALSAPDFYKGEADAVQSTLRTFEEAKAEVEQLYERWEELQSKASGEIA